MRDLRSPLRVLVVASNFPPVVGGIQTYAYEVARELAARCAELLVVAPAVPGCREHDAGAPFEIVRLRSAGDDLAFSGLLGLRRLLRSRRFDAAFATHWAPSFALTTAARLAQVHLPVLVAAHGKELIHRPLARVGFAQYGYDRVRARALHSADGFAAVSHRTAELLRAAGVPAAKVVVAHNGVDAARYTPGLSGRSAGLGGEARWLLSVARLVRRKGIDTVLAALPRVLERVPDVRYAIIGDGPDKPRLEAIVRQQGLSEHVRFLSSVGPELPDYYNSCELFVLPTREEPGDIEGFGLVFLEAGACGKPVIGARAGGVVDAIVHGQTGLLVPPDDEAALGDAILELLTDVPRAQALGRSGRERVQREGTWAHTGDKILALMERSVNAMGLSSS